MSKRLTLSILTLFLMMSSAIGLTTYGDAQILKGKLTIIREGQTLNFSNMDENVSVLSGDVLRVGSQSRVILNTVENTTIRMGSHSVFQVKPWQKRKKTGYARMVYGKMRFATKKLQGKRRFRIKTATATIGVKGTAGDVEVGSTGNTGCVGTEGVIAFQGNSGGSIDLGIDQLAMAVGNTPVNDPVDIPPSEGPADDGQGEDQGADDLDKAPPTSADSSSLGSEDVALETGLIEESDLQESKQEEVGSDVSLDEEAQRQEQDQQIDEQEDVEQDPEFDQDLENTEEGMEIAALEPDIPADTPDFGPAEPTDTPENDDDVDDPDPLPEPPEIDNIDPDSFLGVGRVRPVF